MSLGLRVLGFILKGCKEGPLEFARTNLQSFSPYVTFIYNVNVAVIHPPPPPPEFVLVSGVWRVEKGLGGVLGVGGVWRTVWGGVGGFWGGVLGKSSKVWESGGGGLGVWGSGGLGVWGLGGSGWGLGVWGSGGDHGTLKPSSGKFSIPGQLNFTIVTPLFFHRTPYIGLFTHIRPKTSRNEK